MAEKRYKLTTIRKGRRNQKENPAAKTEMGKSGTYTMKAYRKPNEQLFSQSVITQLSKLNLNMKTCIKRKQVKKF